MARTALRVLGLGHLGIRYGVELRRVLYATTGVDGARTVASGLVATPLGVQPHAVVSYQHATQGHRVNVPSAPHKLEGILVSLVFAGAGYVLAAPDYHGLGSSPGTHPYLHAPTEAASVADLLGILPQVLDDEVPRQTVLLGFSQGGHASLAALQALGSRADVDVVAAASVAGVHRLLESAGPHTLSGVSAHHTTYLAYLAASFARAYDQPLASIVHERWARRLPTMWDGSHGLMEIEHALPRDPSLLLTRETVEDLSGAGTGWFARRLAENSVGDGPTKAPVRFFVGSQDLDTPQDDSRRTADLLRGHGGAAEVVDVGPVDHRGTAFAAVGLARQWFDDVVGASTARSPEPGRLRSLARAVHVLEPLTHPRPVGP
ncbi:MULTISPECIES: hypothetical protein [unclassified Ornithinimicrobium]|uniref:hypothetical protein n=1 Tax=unclassified Ornithinimicrobium TaxID=2615080 RepID=UPI003852511C